MSDPQSDVPDAADADDGPVVVLLDVLPNGRPDDDRPPSRKSPVAYGLGIDSFRLYELALDEDADAAVSDRIGLDGSAVGRYHEVSYDELTRNAAAEVEYAVEAIVDADEARFVDFYNEAGPITLRLHQLNLLPGIGKQLRNNVLDERKRGPFESFAEVSERVSGLHRPREVIVERIVEEIGKDDLKYQTFAGREE
ncbi:DUF655 domain-containing protein [Halorubrum sp. Boch-26]|uniref:DUF655 domain-containing protein n=1 Tax=Halorubrum sp. Boch-26 TaxID=2994426 RepID=UPI002469A9D6|nr:DUF655 domain-containing protein [Halorubrum sp. Boch-26]